jgi:ABC-2 type transport system permease protein
VRRFLAIWRRELAATFLSPVAYVTMVVFFGLTGMIFWDAVKVNVGTHEPLAAMLFAGVIFCLTILVTVVSMRLFAEEKRQGTLETLMTAPVTEAEVVLGKYAGALTFVLFSSTVPVGYVFVLDAMSPGIDFVDLGALAGGYLVTALLAAFTLSIGLFISLLTRNQIVAAIACFCAVWLVLLAGSFGSLGPPAQASLGEYMGSVGHIQDFSRGSVDTRPIVLYLSGTALMLFASVKALESSRWR